MQSVFDYFFSSSSTSTPQVDEVIEPEWVQEVARGDDFVVVDSLDVVAFNNFDELPEVDVRDDLNEELEEQELRRQEQLRRQEVLLQARAKTAQRKYLESVMFADPTSGKDVRKVKNGRPTGSAHQNGVVRRVNATSGTQRAKKTSGKSNDRKIHIEFDIINPHAD